MITARSTGENSTEPSSPSRKGCSALNWVCAKRRDRVARPRAESTLRPEALPSGRFGPAGSRPLLSNGSLEPGHASLPWAGGAVSLPQAFGGQPRLRTPRASALACGLPQDCEPRAVVLCGRESLKVRDEQSDVFECRLLMLFEEETKPAGGEATVTVRLLPSDQCRQLDCLGGSAELVVSV